MRTITRHRSPSSPRGDTKRLCGYCGVAWYRSQLRRDAAGILACPDDQSGLDSLTLSEGNAAAASHRQLGLRTDQSDGGIDSPNTVPDPGFVDPNGIPLNPVNQGPTGPLSVIVDMWLRADTLEATSGVVTRWTDLSNRSNHFFPRSLSTAPTASVDTDGLPMVNFSGAQWLNGSNPTPPRPTWLWVIAKPTVTASSTVIFRGNPGLIVITGFGARAFGSTGFVAGSPAVSGQWNRGILRGGDLDTMNFVTWGSGASSGGAVGLVMGTVPTIGAGSLAGFTPFAGSIKELLVTAGVPTASEIAAIEAYGVARYGGDYFA